MALRSHLLALFCFLGLVGRTVSQANSTSDNGEKVVLDTDAYATHSLLGPDGKSKQWQSLVVENDVVVQATAPFEKVRIISSD